LHVVDEADDGVSRRERRVGGRSHGQRRPGAPLDREDNTAHEDGGGANNTDTEEA